MADKTTYQLALTLKHNRDGSPDNRQTRYRELHNMINHLQTNRGYSKRWDIHKFDRKEVNRLVHDWKKQGLSHGTIENRLSHARWLANHVNSNNTIPKMNKALGLKKMAEPTQKAMELDRLKLATMPEREQLSTELRSEFGLRTEESLKFQYEYATQKDGVIQLKGNWTKGGRPREVQITNDKQRDLLDRIGRYQQANGDRSMIPNHRTYKSYRRDYDEIRLAADVPGHALRHQWAQERFEQVAGIKSPHAGGGLYSELNQEDQARYKYAAGVVNNELGHGHGRQDITATYIGAMR